MQLYSLNVDKIVKKLFEDASLDTRESDILKKRFGLELPSRNTLQSVGDKYSITRERVRQLELQSINQIKKNVLNFEEIKILRDFAENHISVTGGVRENNILMSELRSVIKSEDSQELFNNKIKFLFEVSEYPYFAEENDLFYSFWFTDDKNKNMMQALYEDVIANLINGEKFDSVFQKTISLYSIQEIIAINFLSIFKQLGIGPYGDIGLLEWEEINPKTVRAKAYLLLKKEGVPMHFTEIAKKTGTKIPTMHNELIKDDRFVLIGRGIYGLKN